MQRSKAPWFSMLASALLAMNCGGDESPTPPPPNPGRPDAGSSGGTVIDAPDNQAQRFVSTDARYLPAEWTFDLRQQIAIPNGVREVYVEVRGCRHDYEPPGFFRFKTPEATSWRELSVDTPLCDTPGIPSAQVWLPVSEPPRLVVEALRPPRGGNSYVLTTVKVLGWRLP